VVGSKSQAYGVSGIESTGEFGGKRLVEASPKLQQPEKTLRGNNVVEEG